MGERVRPGNVRRFGTVWNSRVPLFGAAYRSKDGPRLASPGSLRTSIHRAIEAWPIKARPGWLGPLGLAELMFLRSTPGRMGNLLIPSPHLATKSVCDGSWF